MPISSKKLLKKRIKRESKEHKIFRKKQNFVAKLLKSKTFKDFNKEDECVSCYYCRTKITKKDYEKVLRKINKHVPLKAIIVGFHCKKCGSTVDILFREKGYVLPKFEHNPTIDIGFDNLTKKECVKIVEDFIDNKV